MVTSPFEILCKTSLLFLFALSVGFIPGFEKTSVAFDTGELCMIVPVLPNTVSMAWSPLY